MEFASFFNSMGVKVHVVEMMPEILGAMDKETSGMLRAEYAKRGVTFYLNTKVVEVNPHGVVIEKEGKMSAIEAEKILLSVGRKANLSKVGLDKLNIELHRNGVKVDELVYMRVVILQATLYWRILLSVKRKSPSIIF